MGTELGYRSKGYDAVWVVNFPLLEWDEDRNAWHAMHHPFTSSHPDDQHLLDTDPGKVGRRPRRRSARVTPRSHRRALTAALNATLHSRSRMRALRTAHLVP